MCSSPFKFDTNIVCIIRKDIFFFNRKGVMAPLKPQRRGTPGRDGSELNLNTQTIEIENYTKSFKSKQTSHSLTLSVQLHRALPLIKYCSTY